MRVGGGGRSCCGKGPAQPVDQGNYVRVLSDAGIDQTEQGLDPFCALKGSGRPDLSGQRILEFPGRGHVVDPGGQHQGCAGTAAAFGAFGCQDRYGAHPQFCGGIGSDLGKPVGDPGVSKTLKQRLPVPGDVQALGAQVVGGLVPKIFHCLPAQWVGQGFGHSGVPPQLTGIRQDECEPLRSHSFRFS